MCLRSLYVAKMDPSAADMALVVWNGYVRDGRAGSPGLVGNWAYIRAQKCLARYREYHFSSYKRLIVSV
jgi:hypothetical protein